MGSPELLYCPAFKRPGPSGNDRYSLDQDPGEWQELIDDDAGTPSSHYYAGIVHYFPDRGVNGTGSVNRNKRATVNYFADNWDSDSRVSPIMFSCFNKNTSNWGGLFNADSLVSHGARGVNAVMFDGSVRWITSEEVMERGQIPPTGWPHGPDYMSNEGYRNSGSNLQKWAKRYCDLAP
jgi:prepilin-type processing-associated H-X9-DG protein